jgi:hypothetical protein
MNITHGAFVKWCIEGGLAWKATGVSFPLLQTLFTVLQSCYGQPSSFESTTAVQKYLRIYNPFLG